MVGLSNRHIVQPAKVFFAVSPSFRSFQGHRPWLIFGKSHARCFSHFRAATSHEFPDRVPGGIVSPAPVGPYSISLGQTLCECPAVRVFEFRIPVSAEHYFKKLLFRSFELISRDTHLDTETGHTTSEEIVLCPGRFRESPSNQNSQ